MDKLYVVCTPENADDPQFNKVPLWQKLVAVDEDGIVYVPACLGGGENAVFLCAGYDGVTALMFDNHTYYPTDWMAREFPKSKAVCEKIKALMKDVRP